MGHHEQWKAQREFSVHLLAVSGLSMLGRLGSRAEPRPPITVLALFSTESLARW